MLEFALDMQRGLVMGGETFRTPYGPTPPNLLNGPCRQRGESVQPNTPARGAFRPAARSRSHGTAVRGGAVSDLVFNVKNT